MQDYLIIKESGWCRELNCSLTCGQRIPRSHPYFKILVRYSTTPDMTGTPEKTAQEPQEAQKSAPAAKTTEQGSTSGKRAFSAMEEKELRQLAKEEGIRNWHKLKPANLIQKLEELGNHD